MFIKCGYFPSDHSAAFDTYVGAWKYEQKHKYPNIIMLNSLGSRVYNVEDADGGFIVNNLEEAKFVREFLQKEYDVYVNIGNYVPAGSLISGFTDDDGDVYYSVWWKVDITDRKHPYIKTLQTLFTPDSFIRNYYGV